MGMSLKNKNLIDSVIAAFGQQTGLSIHSEFSDSEKDLAFLWIEGVHKPFEVYIKPLLTKQNLPSVIYETSQEKSLHPKILLTPYINPNLMETLRETNVFCLDAVGNGFVKKSPVYVFVTGKKPTTEVPVVKKGRAFQYAGLKVVFALLQNPTLIHQTYREIAEQAGISLGSVGSILKDLADQGYLQMIGNERILSDRKGLMQRWVEAYPLLKQKYFIGSFTTDNPNWWKHIDITGFKGLWSGEVAAEAYTHYLQAKDAIIFLPQAQLAPLLKSARLKKRKAYNEDDTCIDVIEPFWQVGVVNEESHLAPPLLVYADLIQSKDVRNLETAKRIYEQYLD